MFWKKKIKVIIEEKPHTLEQISMLFERRPHPPYFMVSDEEITLYFKQGMQTGKKIFELPLKITQVSELSYRVKKELNDLGVWHIAKKTFEKEMLDSLNRFWSRYEVS